MTAAAIVESKFEGWEKPESNFFKVPNEFWLIEDLTPHERMVLLYILRHTWGFQEFGVMKHIMIDEFQHGRLAADGKRMDKGCGVSRGKASEALKSLEAKGYIQVVTDVTDPARVKKFVMLNMLNNSQDSVQQMNPAFSNRTQRSNPDTRTKKETKERKTTTPLPPANDTDGKTSEEKKEVVKPSKKKEPNAWYDAIEEIFGYVGGLNTNYEKFLRGAATDKTYSRYNLEKPLESPDELRVWAKDWKAKYPNLSMLKAPDKVQSSITTWQKRPQTLKQAVVYANNTSTLAQAELSEEERAAALEALRAAKQKVSA